RDDLVMVNVRRPSGSDPKYRAVRGSRRGHPYPSCSSVLPGKPVAVVEGEVEALLLGQQLGGLLPAGTFGSASDHPTRLGLDPLLPAPVWYVAADADSAGDRSAEVWAALSGRCRRVRPPAPYKDWSEAAQGGVNLYRWWGEVLGGVERPA